jgi:hypothetical protein
VRRRAISWTILAAAALSAAPAGAQNAPLAEALDAYRGGRLDVALERFEAAVRSAGNGPEELAAIHLHLGILRATIGETDVARREFELALAIRPELEAPSELGPEPRALFERIRADRAGRPLRVEVAPVGAARSDAETRIRVAVRDAPADAVPSIGVTAAPANAPPSWRPWSERGPGPEAELVVPAQAWGGGAGLTIMVHALDPWGGTVAHEILDLEAAGEHGAAGDGTGSPPDDDDDGEGGGFFSTAWPWIGLLVIAGGATAAILVLTASDEYVAGPPVVE